MWANICWIQLDLNVDEPEDDYDSNYDNKWS